MQSTKPLNLTTDEERDQEQINKYKRRLVRVTPQHNEEVKRLLRLMGVPVVEVRVVESQVAAELVCTGAR